MMTPLIDSLFEQLGIGPSAASKPPTTANGSPYGVTDNPQTGGAGVPGAPGGPSGAGGALSNPMAGGAPPGAPGPSPAGPPAAPPPGGQPGMPGMGAPPMGAAGAQGAPGSPAGPGAVSPNALQPSPVVSALKAIIAKLSPGQQSGTTTGPGAPPDAPSQPQGWDATVTPAPGVTPNAGPAAPAGPPGGAPGGAPGGPGALSQILGGVASGVGPAVTAAVPNGQALSTAAGAASPILSAIKSAISSPQAAATPSVPPGGTGAPPATPPGVAPTPGAPPGPGVGPTLGASPAVPGVTPINAGGPMGPNNPATPGFQAPQGAAPHPVVTRLQEALRKAAPNGQLPVTPAPSTPGTKTGPQGTTGNDASRIIGDIIAGAGTPGNSKGARFTQGAAGAAKADMEQRAAEAKASQQQFNNKLASNKDQRAGQAETRQGALSDARIANYASQIAKRSDTTLTGAGKASIQKALTNEANSWQGRGKTNAQIDKHINDVSKWMTGDGPYPAEGVDDKTLQPLNKQTPSPDTPVSQGAAPKGQQQAAQAPVEGQIRSNANGDRVQLQGGQWVPLPAAGQ